MVFLLILVLLIWIPFRRSVVGRATYAVGSSEPAAYMAPEKPKQSGSQQTVWRLPKCFSK